MFGIEVLTGYLEEKLAIFGANAVMGIVAESPLGFALEMSARFTEFIESEGISELDKIAAHEVRKLEHPLKFKFKGQELLKKMQDVFSEPVSGSKAAWRRSSWATSRQEWMADLWEHDWRSQPRVPAGSSTTVSTVRGERHAGGEWTFGRMGSPFEGSPAVGRGKPKTSRTKRRLRRYRRYGRLAARDFLKGQDGG